MGSVKGYGLRLKIEEIVNAGQGSGKKDSEEIECWKKELENHVNSLFGVNPADSAGSKVDPRQINAWENCFKFIQENLRDLSQDKQQFELIFEYSLPETANKRPDIILLTDKKVVSLEFKNKDEPQVDENLDDIEQAKYYKAWLEDHHEVTKNRNLEVESYLICTHDKSESGKLRGIEILNRENFCSTIDAVLSGENPCSFTDEWLASPRTENLDIIRDIGIAFRDGKISGLSVVNQECMDAVRKYIREARAQKRKKLILINGVPGSGKTAVGLRTVFEENTNSKGEAEANAVYLSGNGPLVEVLSDQIDYDLGRKHAADDVVKNMSEFKGAYFSRTGYDSPKPPNQAILIFDEAQRAWTEEYMPDKYGYSEPEGLMRVGDRIAAWKNKDGEKREYAVIIGLYGNGQVIFKGEKNDLSEWEKAIKNHSDWDVIVSQDLAEQMTDIKSQLTIDNRFYLSESIRTDFIDYSKWVDQVIGRKGVSVQQTKTEIKRLWNTHMRIFLTRDFDKVRERTKILDNDCKNWKYGIIISSLANEEVINYAVAPKETDEKWEIEKDKTKGKKAKNIVKPGARWNWFKKDCKKLQKACTEFEIQGLELDVPIVIFGGEYYRENGEWKPDPKGKKYKEMKSDPDYDDVDTIVENIFRVLLTRARKEMIIVIPQYQGPEDPLKDTYNYFAEMGKDVLGRPFLIPLGEDPNNKS